MRCNSMEREGQKKKPHETKAARMASIRDDRYFAAKKKKGCFFALFTHEARRGDLR